MSWLTDYTYYKHNIIYAISREALVVMQIHGFGY